MAEFKFTKKRKAALKKAQGKAWKRKKSGSQLMAFRKARLTYFQMSHIESKIKSGYKKVGLK
jgi:hypothetical protein